MMLMTIWLSQKQESYNSIGQVVSQIDALGRETLYTYDGVGNQISSVLPYLNKVIITTYDFHNKPIQITEVDDGDQLTLTNSYDILGRKIATTDRYGNTTNYEFDAFHRLIKVIYPEVMDETGQTICPTFSYTYDIFGNVLTIS